MPPPLLIFLQAGVEDCYTSSRGHTRTLGNFVKAVYFALAKTYGYLSPELWKPTVFQVSAMVLFGILHNVCSYIPLCKTLLDLSVIILLKH